MESIEARLAADWNDNYLTNQRVENVQVFGLSNGFTTDNDLRGTLYHYFQSI